MVSRKRSGRFGRTGSFLACAAVAFAVGAHRAPADSPQHDRNREALENLYIEEYSGRGPLYQSAPVTHVVPSLKTVTLALAVDRYNVEVSDATATDGSTDSLALSGYRAAPYIAVSLKRLGLGFSAETGERHAAYKVLYNGTATQRVQQSDVDYKAIGVYMYLLPFETKGERSISASLVFGAKDYNVTHKITPVNSPTDPTAGQVKFRYNMNEFMAGTLVEFRLLKFFALQPWLDYSYMDAHDPLTQASDASGQRTSVAGTLEGDANMFWLSRPRLDFGLDMVVKTHGFAVHLGQAFGFLLSQRDNDQIIDKTLSLSVSQDLKGD